MARKRGGDRDWRRYERDWKGYERYRRDEVNLYLNKAKDLIESNPAPWTPGKMGQPPYPPRTMVILLLLKTWLGMDYRSISSYLRAFPEQRAKLGLKKPLSHTSIRNHMLRLPEACHPQSPHNERYTSRLPNPQETPQADTERQRGHMPRPAYLSRRNCNLIAKKGRAPFIKPKRNTTIRKRGSQPWRDMVTLWFENQAAFLKRYHQRSKAESVYSTLKRCY